MTRRTRPHSRPPTPSDDACDPLSASSCLSYWAWSSRLCFLQLPHHNQLSICSKTIQAVVVSRRKSTASWRIGWNKLVKHRRRHPGRGGGVEEGHRSGILPLVKWKVQATGVGHFCRLSIPTSGWIPTFSPRMAAGLGNPRDTPTPFPLVASSILSG